MRWARTAANLFWLWTLLGTLWAWFVPEHFTWFLGTLPGTSLKLTALGLGVIMLGMGLTLSFADVKRALAMPQAALIGVLAQFVIMPFLGWGVATLFRLEDDLKLGLILVSCCPGGTASNVVTYLARANVALSVLMTMASTLLAIILTPFLTKGYASLAVPMEVEALPMVMSMLTIVLVPVLAGVALNRVFGERLRLVREVSPLLSIIVIVLIVGGIVGASKTLIAEHFDSLLLAVFLLHVAGFLFGYLWAWVFRLEVAERRTVSIEVGMQNSGLGTVLARTHFPLLPGAAATCAISAVYHCLIGSILASHWRARPPSDPDGKAGE
jgi:BASS family bile acid:Na+ symporter